MPKKDQGKPETADGYSMVANEYLEALYKDPNLKLPTRIRIYIHALDMGVWQKRGQVIPG